MPPNTVVPPITVSPSRAGFAYATSRSSCSHDDDAAVYQASPDKRSPPVVAPGTGSRPRIAAAQSSDRAMSGEFRELVSSSSLATRADAKGPPPRDRWVVPRAPRQTDRDRIRRGSRLAAARRALPASRPRSARPRPRTRRPAPRSNHCRGDSVGRIPRSRRVARPAVRMPPLVGMARRARGRWRWGEGDRRCVTGHSRTTRSRRYVVVSRSPSPSRRPCRQQVAPAGADDPRRRPKVRRTPARGG